MLENRIGAERARLRISQSELAKELGVSNKSVSNWEVDAKKCPPKHLIKLADRFTCTTDYLLGISEDKYQEKLARKTKKR